MRKSFIFLAFILVFALGQGAFAQTCDIELTSVGPLTLGGNVQTAKLTTVTISVDAGCLPAGDGYSPTNGFVLYSDPGDPQGQCGLGLVGGSLSAAFTGDLIFDFGPFNNYFVHDGSAWQKQGTIPFSTVSGDSVAVMWGGVASAAGHGMISTFDDVALTFYFTVPETDSAKTVCIDQGLSGIPGAVWKWAPVIVTNATVYPTWSGVECFATEFIPNQPPEILNAGSFPASFDHCSPATFKFEVGDFEGDPITGFNFSGPGAVVADGDGVHWTWTWAAPDQNSTTPMTLGFCDNFGCGTDSVFSVVTTNAAPVCAVPEPFMSVSAGTEKSLVVTGSDDCDVMIYSICETRYTGLDGTDAAVVMAPAGAAYSVTAGDNASVEVFFAPLAADQGFWEFDICVDDGDSTAVCMLEWEVIIGGAYGVEIDKAHDVPQGLFMELDVNLTKMDTTMGLGGFDILIAYDPTCLAFHQALEGELYGAEGCEWEYFTYRFGPYGNCGNACPSGMVQVIGMAETNDGANHPTCDVPFWPDPLSDPPVVVNMFKLKFLVSNDRTLNCQFCPVRFFWYDCTNNALSNHDGSLLYLSVGVYDYSNPNPINSLDVEFPTYLGAQEECYVGHDPTKPAPEANVDFQNGGVDIVCSDSIDAPGDININGIPYEIADAVMFTNYFISGPSAFGTHIDGSIAASDANMDGIPLTVSDLVYLIRVVVGDALPYNKVSATAKYTVVDGIVSVDAAMGAALIVAEGNASATALNGVQVQQGMVDGNTHILVTGWDQNDNTFAGFSGEFVNVDRDIISIEFAAADGSMVNASNVPTTFEVFQNYPNPFNPTTKITATNPSNKAWTVTIYNVTGQRVDQFAGDNGYVISVDWDASRFASGIYFYKVVAGDNVETKKMVLLK